MCRLLAELSQTEPRLMSETIKRLEERTGLPGSDIRMTADIHAQVHLKIRALGLDPHDTHPKELYVALQNMAATHEQFLLKKFRLPKAPATQELPMHVAFMFERLRFNRRSWLLRPVALRRLLNAQPPKQLVKALGYRTVDSMIKREPVDVLLFLATKLESNTWQQQFNKQLQKLHVTDFEERTLNVRTLEHSRYLKVAHELSSREHNFVFGLPLVGTIFLLPSKAAPRPGMVLLALMMALKEATELQFAHSYLRHHQMEASFTTKLAPVLRQRQLSQTQIAGQIFDWRMLHRHFGRQSGDAHPLLFQPHLQAEDLAYRRAEEILYRIEPALHFWHGTDYVGLQTAAGTVSFNLLDVLINLVNGVSLQAQHSGHLHQAVWDELLLRYMQHGAIESSVLTQLTAPEQVHDMEFIA